MDIHEALGFPQPTSYPRGKPSPSALAYTNIHSSYERGGFDVQHRKYDGCRATVRNREVKGTAGKPTHFPLAAADGWYWSKWSLLHRRQSPFLVLPYHLTLESRNAQPRSLSLSLDSLLVELSVALSSAVVPLLQLRPEIEVQMPMRQWHPQDRHGMS